MKLQNDDMRTTVRHILLMLLLVLMGCTKKNVVPRYPHSSRVVLVYMAGDNNLGGYVQDNLDAMAQGMASAPAGSRTIAYVDTPGERPRLVEVTASGIGTLYTWPGPHDSASAATVREAVALTRSLAPADRYGLVLWSHGAGLDAFVGCGLPHPHDGPCGGSLACDQMVRSGHGRESRGVPRYGAAGGCHSLRGVRLDFARCLLHGLGRDTLRAARQGRTDRLLARTVLYEAHTSTMLGLGLDACCGLSMYVPVSAYGDLNGYYRTLGWYARCYANVLTL